MVTYFWTIVFVLIMSCRMITCRVSYPIKSEEVKLLWFWQRCKPLRDNTNHVLGTTVADWCLHLTQETEITHFLKITLKRPAAMLTIWRSKFSNVLYSPNQLFPRGISWESLASFGWIFRLFSGMDYVTSNMNVDCDSVRIWNVNVLAYLLELCRLVETKWSLCHDSQYVEIDTLSEVHFEYKCSASPDWLAWFFSCPSGLQEERVKRVLWLQILS